MGGYLVVNTPEGVVFGIVVFPEPFEGNVGLVVGVLPLPLVDGHFGIGERAEGVFGCLFPWNTIIFLFLGFVLLLGRLLGFLGDFLLGSGLFLGCCFLLGCYKRVREVGDGGGTSVLDALGEEFGFARDFEVGLEVADQLPESHNTGVSLRILLVEQLQTN